MVRRADNSGFTLIELILVLVILALGAALAMPALHDFTIGRRLPNAAVEFVTTANWCRVQAIGDGATYHLNLDTTGGAARWWVTKDDGSGRNFVSANSDFMPEYDLPAEINLGTNILPSNSGQGIYIAFDAGGHTDSGTVTLSAGSNEITITCDTPLGSYHVMGGQ